jgi:hypothetical protein
VTRRPDPDVGVAYLLICAAIVAALLLLIYNTSP